MSGGHCFWGVCVLVVIAGSWWGGVGVGRCVGLSYMGAGLLWAPLGVCWCWCCVGLVLVSLFVAGVVVGVGISRCVVVMVVVEVMVVRVVTCHVRSINM